MFYPQTFITIKHVHSSPRRHERKNRPEPNFVDSLWFTHTTTSSPIVKVHPSRPKTHSRACCTRCQSILTNLHINMTYLPSNILLHIQKNEHSLSFIPIFSSHVLSETYDKKEEIWLSPLTKAPTSTEKSKKELDNTKTPPKPSITQPLQTVLGRSVGVINSHPTGVFKPVFGSPAFPLSHNSRVIKRTHDTWIELTPSPSCPPYLFSLSHAKRLSRHRIWHLMRVTSISLTSSIFPISSNWTRIRTSVLFFAGAYL